MLKRHLMTHYNMTPEEYRSKWGLKPDYPMVAPAYARKRQELAKHIGLGRKPRGKPPAVKAKPGGSGRSRPPPNAPRTGPVALQRSNRPP
jgi:hypothetical protein